MTLEDKILNIEADIEEIKKQQEQQMKENEEYMTTMSANTKEIEGMREIIRLIQALTTGELSPEIANQRIGELIKSNQ